MTCAILAYIEARFKTLLEKKIWIWLGTQAEFLKYTNKGIEAKVIGTDNEYLIPIASTENNNLYEFKMKKIKI